MTPEECAEAINKPVNLFGTKWMFEPQTYAAAGELGFGVMDFYMCGRAGVVPGIDAQGAHDTMGIFGLDLVLESWEAGESRQPIARTAAMWADACADAGRRHLTDDASTARLAELAARVVGEADGSQCPIFLGWRSLTPPEDVPGAAAHHLNGLRELRGGYHIAGLLDADVSPYVAVIHRAGEDMAGLFGHAPPFEPASADTIARWEAAESATGMAMTRELGVLNGDELDELATLVDAMNA